MKPTRWSIALGLLFFLAMNGQGRAGDVLNLASGPNSSRAYHAAVGLASLIKFKLLPSKKLDLLILNSSGAVDNIHKLKADDAQFAILPAAVGHAARLGSGSFAGDPPATGFRVIATLWQDALHLVMRRDDVATGTIDDLKRLKEGRILLGDMSTGMVDAHHLLLADLGLRTAKTIDPSGIADGDGILAIKQGQIDVLSAAVRPPEASLTTMFDDDLSELRLLDVTEQQMVEANGNHWLWTPYVIPASTYPGQHEDVWTMALSTLLVVRADVDADVVHAVTKSVFENLDYLKRVDPILGDLALDKALSGVTMPLHPGALRYYRETGLVPKPAAASSDQPQKPTEIFEQYPDDNVAGEWPNGLGGPLLRTAPVTNTNQLGIKGQSGDGWRRRATL